MPVSGVLEVNAPDLETRLQALMARMCCETLNRKEYGKLWGEFVSLHAQRSPEVVRQMENRMRIT